MGGDHVQRLCRQATNAMQMFEIVLIVENDTPCLIHICCPILQSSKSLDKMRLSGLDRKAAGQIFGISCAGNAFCEQRHDAH
ncbi:hypothetical protein AA12467_0539 [Gluconobacter sphaericus NBRC 12467]|nr:hypothetical protein AA12467_0539 [Gluconobacter sphaericus NBRC 12467]